MTDTSITTYRTQPGETFTSIAETLGINPAQLYLQNTDVPLVNGTAGEDGEPPAPYGVRIDFFAKGGDHLDRVAQQLHVTHSFLYPLISRDAMLKEKQSDSWHWYEFANSVSIFINTKVTVPRDPIAGGALLYMPWTERPLREERPIPEDALNAPAVDKAGDPTAKTTVRAGRFETFEEIAERANVDPVALYLRNAGVPMNRREITIPFPEKEGGSNSNPERPTQFTAPEGSKIADIAATLGVTKIALIGTYPRMKTLAEIDGDSRNLVLDEDYVFMPEKLKPSSHKVTITFEAKQGEHLEQVARRIGIHQTFLYEFIFYSPHGHLLRKVTDDFKTFSWYELREDVSFSREVTVKIPQDFIREATTLALPNQNAKTIGRPEEFSSVGTEEEAPPTTEEEQIAANVEAANGNAATPDATEITTTPGTDIKAIITFINPTPVK